MPDTLTREETAKRRAARACINSKTPEGWLTAPQTAELLGVTHVTVFRWWKSWHPDTALVPGWGKGLALLTPVDLMVAKAWQVLDAGHQNPAGQRIAARERAERAVRRDPKPWLVVDEHSAATFDDLEAAVQRWKAGGWLMRLGEVSSCS